MFRFTIFDYTNSDGSTGIEIDEPVGWDGAELAIKRDATWHGVFFEYQTQTVQVYDENAVSVLRNAYAVSGIEAHVEMLIEYHCEECDDCFEELYRGRFDFGDYTDVCGTECYVKIAIMATGCLMDFRNASETPVDLDSLKGFDGITELQVYDGLGAETDIVSKAILFTDSAKIDDVNDDNITDFKTQFTVGNSFGGNPDDTTKYYYIPYGQNVLFEEFEVFNPPPTIDGTNPIDIDGFYFFEAQSDSDFNISSDVIFNISMTGADVSFHTQTKWQLWKRSSGVNTLLHEVDYLQQDGGALSPINQNINDSYTATFSLLTGDRLAYVLKVRGWVDNDDLTVLELTMGEGSDLKITNLSIADTTKSKTYLVNEVASRIVEAVTNDCMRVYSDYFGRTDAQPYPSEVDGCGSLAVLTKGELLRRLNLVRDSTNKIIFAISFADFFSSMAAIHNIGIGIEDDTNRTGYKMVRMEKFEYFYKDNIVLNLENVSTETKTANTLIYNQYKFGYDKWEAEEYNGLDEFLTKREYRTTITQKRNTLEKISKFIASGYAMEITRRKGNSDSTDWRFDGDTFIICMRRGHAGHGVLVEQGSIDTSPTPENIIDPDTIYNFRISPVRMALRWIKHIFQCYKSIDSNAQLIFTNGEANVSAYGKLNSSICRLEAGALKENQIIDNTTFDDIAECTPIYSAERVTISDIPLSFKDFTYIRNNPYGLIQYSCNEETKYGWIETCAYKMNGLASLTLIPKFI